MADTNTKTDAYMFTRIYDNLKRTAQLCDAAGLENMSALLVVMYVRLAAKHTEVVTK